MRQPSALGLSFFAVWLSATVALSQPETVHGCGLQLQSCGNGPVLCHIFANQATDLPDPRRFTNDPNFSDAGPISANEWANVCYRLYVGIVLQADTNRAISDPLAQIYSALQAATSAAAPSVFSAIFYNPTNETRQGKIIYVGATRPLPDKNQSPEAYPSTQFVQDNKEAIFQSLALGGQEQLVVDVPPNGGMAMKVYSPRSVPNPKTGFYGAGTFSEEQQSKILFDSRLVLLLGAFRRIQQ